MYLPLCHSARRDFASGFGVTVFRSRFTSLSVSRPSGDRASPRHLRERNCTSTAPKLSKTLRSRPFIPDGFRHFEGTDRSFAMYVALLGRHRARCLTVRLPMPPVRPVRETFASYGSRQRDIMGKVHFASSTAHSPWTALRVRWVPLYCFPTLSLGAFAVSPRPGVPSFPGFRLLCPI